MDNTYYPCNQLFSNAISIYLGIWMLPFLNAWSVKIRLINFFCQVAMLVLLSLTYAAISFAYLHFSHLSFTPSLNVSIVFTSCLIATRLTNHKIIIFALVSSWDWLALKLW